MNSVINAGAQGIVQSQQALQQHAHSIASSPVAQGPIEVSAPNAPVSPVTEAANASRVDENRSKTDIAQEFISLRQQAQVFTASANVVSVGSESVGSLIDDYS